MADSESFREETRRWLVANAPASMYTPPQSPDEIGWGGRKARYPNDIKRWLDMMAERGWTAPTWPRAYGGGGLSKAEAKMLAEEMAKLRLRPPLTGFGLSMIGPLLLQEGSEELRREHLPPIVRGEFRWCQGYSEPGAGSDLAGLQTRAVRDGDVFVLNGQKVWTSFADKADWMFLLVRTDFEAPKHAGITFLLMDMETPGVTVRPIKLISGSSPFCETFLADVRVPVRNVVGRVNGGWLLAKALLGHERTMIADAFKERDDAKRLVALARRYLGEESGRIADARARDRVAQLEMDQACLDLTLARARDGAKAGHKPGPESSIFKLYGTELNQRRRALMVETLGPQALGYRDLMVVMEEMGRGLMPEPMLSTVLLGANAILLGGSEAQRREHLPAVAAGERLLALAWQEPGSRYDPHHVETRAERAGGGWRLRGEKIQVLDGAAADRLVVSARTAGGARDVEGITLFVVRSDAPGVALERQVRVDSRGAALLHLADARVEPDAVLGQVGRGGPLLAPVLDRATVGLTAEMLGSMSAAFEMTIDYLKTRLQFGVPIR